MKWRRSEADKEVQCLAITNLLERYFGKLINIKGSIKGIQKSKELLQRMNVYNCRAAVNGVQKIFVT